MTRICVSALALATLAGTTMAQQVELRIVERRGQQNVLVPFPTTSAATAGTDRSFDFAVQARVTGIDPSNGRPWALGGFAFDVILVGEPDALTAGAGGGVLNKLKISNDAIDPNPYGVNAEDSSVSPFGYPTGSALGVHGMPYQYTYAAGINAGLSGSINTTGGTFTNTTANQEIGLIVGQVAGSRMLTGSRVYTPGTAPTPLVQSMDRFTGDVFNPNGADGKPDSWNALHPYDSDNGDATPQPASLDTATLDPVLAGPCFGAGQFIDIFRFQYRVAAAATANRTITVTLGGDFGLQLFSELQFNNGDWGARNYNVQGLGSNPVPGSSFTIQPTTFTVGPIPAPGSVALLGLGGLVVARRRRA